MKYFKKISFFILLQSFFFLYGTPLQKHIISLTFNTYRYEEPAVMDLNGSAVGIDYLYRKYFKNYFLEGNTSFSSSKNKYTSKKTGSIDEEPTWYSDNKVLFGYTLTPVSSGISMLPYVGIGFRYLQNDTSNIKTSTGAVGYLRTNQLFYLPIGIIYNYELLKNKFFDFHMEYCHVISGKQFSGLKGLPTVYNGMLYYFARDSINYQKNGFGVNFSGNYIIGKMSIGSFVKYWSIDDSTVDKVPIGTGPYKKGMCEPNNNTTEIGINFSLIF